MILNSAFRKVLKHELLSCLKIKVLLIAIQKLTFFDFKFHPFSLNLISRKTL